MKIATYILLTLLILVGCREKKTEQNNIGEVVYYLNDDGQIDGILTQYHMNGQVNWEVKFVNGLKQDKVDYFDSVGTLIQTANFLNSKLDGINLTYHPNSKVKWSTNYKNGVKTGEHLRFSPDNKLLIKRIYLQDSLIEELEFDTDGNITNHYIIVQDSIAILDTITTIKYEILNPYYDIFGLEILAIDSKKKVDTIYQGFFASTQYSIDINNSEILDKRVEAIYIEVDSINVIKGIKRFSYDF